MIGHDLETIFEIAWRIIVFRLNSVVFGGPRRTDLTQSDFIHLAGFPVGAARPASSARAST
jgi:hypothetical protein